MRLRARIALWTLRWAYRLENGLAAVVDQSSLLEFNKASFTRQSPYWISQADEGLDPAEAQVVDMVGTGAGRALCLGSGAGREAFAFARRGCDVVGVEQVEEMVRFSREHGDRHRLKVRFINSDMADLELSERFDRIFMLNIAYSYVPARRRRVALLGSCLKHLRPEGICVVSFVVKRPTETEIKWFAPLKAVAALAGNPGYEIGDRLDSAPSYMHRFPSREAVGDEAREAGFTRVQYLSPAASEHFAVLSQ